MKKFQSLNEDLFNDQKLSKESLSKIYGGLSDDSGTTIDRSTHQATDANTNHDATDSDENKKPDPIKKDIQ